MVIKKILLFVLMSSFLVWSFWDVSHSVRNYMQFHSRLIQGYDEPIGTTIPVVTFCGQKAQFVTDKYFEEKMGHPVERPIGLEESNTIADSLSGMSPEEQFSALYSAEDLKQLVKWHVFHDKKGPFHWPDTVQLSINADLYCFTLKHDVEDRYFSLGDQFDPAVSIRLSFKLPEIMAMVFDVGETLFDLKEYKYQVISLEPKKSTNLIYELSTFEMLPAPYDTNCQAYEREGPGSYDQFYNDYIKNGFKEQYNCLPDAYMVHPGEDTKVCMLSKEFKVDPGVMQHIFGSVAKHMKESCFQQFYSLTQDKGFTSPRDNVTDAHTINVYPEQLVKKMVFVPATPFIAFVVDILDVLSLWLVFLCVYLLISIRIKSTMFKNPMESL